MKVFGEVTLIQHIENWFFTLNTISYVPTSYKLLKLKEKSLWFQSGLCRLICFIGYFFFKSVKPFPPLLLSN